MTDNVPNGIFDTANRNFMRGLVHSAKYSLDTIEERQSGEPKKCDCHISAAFGHGVVVSS